MKRLLKATFHEIPIECGTYGMLWIKLLKKFDVKRILLNRKWVILDVGRGWVNAISEENLNKLKI